MITNTTQRFLRFFLMFIISLWRKNTSRKYVFVPFLIILFGFLIPFKMDNPVKGATVKDWNEKSFWAYPWGSSITHKGIDIFKERHTEVLSSTHGIVFYVSEGGKGGNAVMVLGPKWRFHYYAHLESIAVYPLQPIKRGGVIGSVGDSGNAKGKPTHLHYAITTPFPYVHLYDKVAVHGWKKMFYLNPDTWLRK